eukprot:scaffold11391_cov125-Isochrysis_galbana.AAC.1
MLAILARQVSRIRAKSFSPTRHLNRAWFSPLSMRCLRPCTPPVRLFSVYSLRVQPPIRHQPCRDEHIAPAECTPRQPYGCSPHWIVTEACFILSLTIKPSPPPYGGGDRSKKTAGSHADQIKAPLASGTI